MNYGRWPLVVYPSLPVPRFQGQFAVADGVLFVARHGAWTKAAP